MAVGLVIVPTLVRLNSLWRFLVLLCVDSVAVCVSPQQAKPSSLPWQLVAPSSSSNNSLPPSYSNGQSKVVAWLQESEEMDKCAEGKCSFPHYAGNKQWTTSGYRPYDKSRIADHCVSWHVLLNAFGHMWVSILFFRARTMPVQPDRAEPAIAESGDSTKDTVSAQLHRYAGETHTHTQTAESGGKQFSQCFI